MHTPKCIEVTNRLKAARERYKKSWNYCPTCEGWGGSVVILDNEDLIFEPCDDCGITNPSCPRCGESALKFNGDVESWLLNQEPCPHCNYNWGVSESDALPEEPECIC